MTKILREVRYIKEGASMGRVLDMPLLLLVVILDSKLSLIDVYYRRLLERDKRKRLEEQLLASVSMYNIHYMYFSIAKQHSLIGGKQRLSCK